MKRNHFFILALFVYSINISAQVNLSNGLAAYYPFNGNANDASGNSNNGVVTAAVLTTDRFGNPGSAYYFDGSSAFIQVANSFSLNPTSQITLTAWYKTDFDFTGNGNDALISKPKTSQTSPYYQYQLGVGGALFNPSINAFQFSLGNNNNFNYVSTPDDYNYSNGVWHFLAATYNGSSAKIYVDGILENSLSLTGNFPTYSTDLYIGKNPNTGNFAQGFIDDIRIYNRAINSSELNALNSDVPFTVSLGPDQTITAGSNIAITVNTSPSLSGGLSYSWSNGATTPNMVVSPCSSNNYSVTVSNLFGYSTSDAINITVVGISTNGLVAYYPFNGNANDASDNGNNGAVTGAVLTTDRFGNPYSAYYFNGTSAFIQVANSYSLNPSSQITLTTWYKTDFDFAGNGNDALISKPYTSLNSPYYQYQLGVGGALFNPSINAFQFSLGNNSNFNYVSTPDSYNYSNEVWHFLVAIYNVSSAKLYVDGVLQNTLSLTGNLPSYPTDLYIGKNVNSGFFAQGFIDDIRIYNRSISTCEMTELYTEINTSTVTPTCSVNAGSNQTICSVETASLTATGPNILSYLWSTGASSQSIAVHPTVTTSYNVTTTGAGGCKTTDEIIVYVNSSVNLKNGLVAYYPFNGNANDASGNGNHGIVTGAVLTTDRFGNLNNAYFFNGTSDFIKIFNSTSLNPSSQITLAAWYKTDVDFAGNGNDAIVSKPFTSHINPYYQYQLGVGGALFNPSINAFQFSLGNNDNFNYVSTPDEYNGSSAKLYVDDTLKNLLDLNGALPIYSTDLYIGKNINNGFFAQGFIDDIRIYSRAITTCEINSLYNEVYTSTVTCSVNAGINTSICLGNSTNLIAMGSSNITSYLWSNGSTTQNINVAPTASTSYYVTASALGGCQATDTVVVLVENCSSNAIVPICIVGVDSTTGKNAVIWDKPSTTNIDSFLIYRETNQANVYSQIGTQGYNAFSTFIDNASVPAQQANLYKLASKDTSGQISGLSEHHKTIHLTINAGLGGSWNLIWNNYEGITLSTYNIYRGTTKANMSLLTSISASLNSYSDLTPPTGTIYYQIEVVNSIGCSPSKKESYSSSKSNIVEILGSSVSEDFNADQVFVYPDPNDGDFTIEVFNSKNTEMNLVLFNLLGQQVYETKLIGSKTNIKLNGLPKGVYSLRLFSGNGSVVKRIIIE